MKRLLVLLVLVAGALTAVSAFMVTVLSDRVTIGAEFMPRRLELPNNLIVQAGTVMELPADATYDYIEVQQGGTLRVSRTRDTVTRFTHLVNLPGGTLDVGTVADPIPCDRKVDWSVRDVPIDFSKDPFQWGNGVINFGQQTRVGCQKTPWVEATGSIAAGATTVTLASLPVGWQVGDELLIPDTTTPSQTTLVPKREAVVTIATLTGAALTLSKPLDFAHPTIVDPQGVVVLRPRVANLTRNIVVRSENPAGVRGHVVDLGHGTATFDIRYNQFIGLGRTTIAPLEDTVLATGHIGTNQRGKYGCLHAHHIESSPTSVFLGNSCMAGVGPALSKFGVVVHNASDIRIEDNGAIDFPGANFVAEDGYEVRNIFKHNFAAYSSGKNGALDGIGDGNAAHNVARICPACEGSGFWLRGVMNTIDGNEAWNNRSAGINLFNQDQPIGLYPKVAGGPSDTALNHTKDLPVSVTDNVVAANVARGFEVWGVNRFPYRHFIMAHNGLQNMAVASSEGVNIYLQNPTVICAVGSGAEGISSSQAYADLFEIDQGGHIAGCTVGVFGGGGAHGLVLTGTVLQNDTNIDQLPIINTVFTNVMHVPLGTLPHRYVVFPNFIWDPTGPLPVVGVSLWTPQRGSPFVVKNWQGTGQDYRLFYLQSLGSKPAWYSGKEPHQYNTPVKGVTMKQSWETYGLSFGGDMLEESLALDLDGIINAKARAGLAVPFGPPRVIVTWPTPREPIPAVNVTIGAIRVYAILTGDPAAASDVVSMVVDSDDPVLYRQDFTDERNVITPHVGPGWHIVKVARTKKDAPSEVLPGSDYTGCYFSGPTLTPAPAVCGAVTTQLLCTDPTATNVGGPLPCVFPPPVCLPPAVLVNGACVIPPPPVLSLLPAGTYELCKVSVAPPLCSRWIQP